MAGIGHEGTPGDLVIFILNLGFMGVSLGEFKKLYPYDIYSFLYVCYTSVHILLKNKKKGKNLLLLWYPNVLDFNIKAA